MSIAAPQKARICEMREAGHKLADISVATGASVAAVRRLCVHAGAEHPTKAPRLLPPGRAAYRRGRHTVRPYTAQEDALMEQMRKAGASYRAIAGALDPPRRYSSVRDRLTTLARHAALEDACG